MAAVETDDVIRARRIKLYILWLYRIDIDDLQAGIMWAAGHLVSRTRTCVLCNLRRSFASKTVGEDRITEVLKTKFPLASCVRVVDISGGCGAMYEVHVESEEFKNKRTVQQHQMINEALQEEIKSMHGLRIFTSVPKH
ncbi:LOW QUALITY PROTEIN: bolA-like protein 3 [Dendropsophus ebraccatus]|uniref:LOW QUALITY PROTEIN: bolA-like protein 3 n=1 Tax=Dendropsophus ebraccatus TaxID=150705 RepID=UPI00383123BE